MKQKGNNVQTIISRATDRLGSLAHYYINTLKPFKKRDGEHLLVACFPKSGSTYLSRLLSDVTGYPLRGFVQCYGHNEQDLFEVAIRRYRY